MLHYTKHRTPGFISEREINVYFYFPPYGNYETALDYICVRMYMRMCRLFTSPSKFNPQWNFSQQRIPRRFYRRSSGYWCFLWYGHPVPLQESELRCWQWLTRLRQLHLVACDWGFNVLYACACAGFILLRLMLGILRLFRYVANMNAQNWSISKSIHWMKCTWTGTSCVYRREFIYIYI